MTLHHTCGKIILVTAEEATARGEKACPHPGIPGPGNFQVPCGKDAVLWIKNGLHEEFEHDPNAFSSVLGMCEEHREIVLKGLESYGPVGGHPLTMTLDDVTVWETMTL